MNRIDVRKVDMQSIQSYHKNESKANNAASFKEVLDSASQGIKFSKHAIERLKMRNVQLNRNQLERIESGIEKAEKKGVKDTLLLMDDIAFIANTKSKTIITTVQRENLKDNIFTNIDGAVIL
jgi:flagellar operon protein